MFYLRAALLLFFTLQAPMVHAYDECDLENFRWPCKFKAYLKPSRTAPSVLHCGDETFYISKTSYDKFARNNYDDIIMTMNINGLYFESPCILGEKDPVPVPKRGRR